MQYGEIIRIRRKALNMNQADLASRVGVSRNTVAGWETGHSRPDLDCLPQLCEALRISLARFFGRESQKSAEDRRILDLFHSLGTGDREVITWQMEALRDRRAEQQANTAEEKPRLIQLFRNDLGAAAGFGAALGETQGEWIHVLADRETELADEIITVCGRSMEPVYQDGDQVLVQHTGHLRFGEVGVFLVDNEGYIKEYQEDGLHSFNPDYKTMTFREDQPVRCLGRVIGKLKKTQLPSGRQLQMLDDNC